MKLHADCIPCIVYVRYNELENIVKAEKSVEYLGYVLREFSNYILSGETNVTRIATNLFRLVKRLTGLEDPYRDFKHRANIDGLKVYKEVRRLLNTIANNRERLELAVKASLLGNALDLGVAGYTPPSLSELVEALHSLDVRGLENIDILERVYSKTVLYLLDNAGEAALDRLLAEELRRRGAVVVGVVKTGSFQNDVTVYEVEELELNESFSKIIETGTDASSIFLDEISQELRNHLEKTDIIIAKGMAHFEYLTDIKDIIGKPILYMLRAKCRPIARELGVQVGDFITHLYVPKRD